MPTQGPPLRVAVARPLWARNHTAFERQADVYAYIQAHYPVTIDVLADERFGFSDARLRTVLVRADDGNGLLQGALRRLHLPTDHYRSMRDLVGYDVIETEDPSVFYWGAYAAHAARGTGARLVLWASENRASNTGAPAWLHRRLARRLVPQARALLVPTILQAERYRALGLGPLPVFSDMYGIDTDRFSPRPAERQPGLVISVGKLIPQKGHHVVIPAFARAARTTPDARLVLIGGGDPRYTARLKSIAQEHGVADRVEMPGALPGDQINQMYRQASVFVLHSLSEGTVDEKFGAVYLEAMASGLPIIGSRCGGVPYVLGETGRVVEQNDGAAIEHHLRELLESAPLRERLGALARERAIQQYDLPVVAHRWYQAWSGA